MNYKSITRTALALPLALLLILTGCSAVNGVDKSEITSPAATQEPPANPEDVTLYDKFGLSVAIPNEIIDRLIVTTEPKWEMYEGTYLLSVYEKRSYEEAQAVYPDGYAGYIFSIARYNQAQYEQFLCSDGSGQSFFAKDDTYYYGWFIPTDVQFYYEGNLDMDSDAWKSWIELNERCKAIKDDFIARNNLTPYSDSEFRDKEFTYEGAHIYLTYYPYYAYQSTAEQQGFKWQDVAYTLVLSQPAAQGDKGIWCVERWHDNYDTLYYEFPNIDDESATDYFAAAQHAADSGKDVAQLNPMKVALDFVHNRLEQKLATEDSFKTADGVPGKTGEAGTSSKSQEESTVSPEVKGTETSTTDFENTGWQVISIEPKDYGITDDMLKSLIIEDFSKYPLDKLVAYYLHTDGAGAEGSGDELYKRFMEAPNTVLTFIALIGDQKVTLTGMGDVSAYKVLCQDIAGADVAWYGITDTFIDILEKYGIIYPSGRIAELLTCLKEEHDASIERNT